MGDQGRLASCQRAESGKAQRTLGNVSNFFNALYHITLGAITTLPKNCWTCHKRRDSIGDKLICLKQ